MSPWVTVTRLATSAAFTFDSARCSISGEMSTAVTRAPRRRAISIAVVATPQPTSSTRLDSVMPARASNASVEARPPGWITCLPMTAMNAYGSSAATSRAASLVMSLPAQALFKLSLEYRPGGTAHKSKGAVSR